VVDLLGLAELAREAGVKPRTLAGYLSRGFTPEPDARLACGPIWHRDTVQPWLEEREQRLERAISAADAVLADAVGKPSAVTGLALRQQRAETARRNGRWRKYNLPTVTGEAYSYVARAVIDSGIVDSPDDRAEKALRRRAARQAVRVESADGIPF